MILLDVNVLITAFRVDVHRHAEVIGWLREALESGEIIGVPDTAITSFLRLVTNHRVFVEPSPTATAVEFVEALLSRPLASVVTAGPRHWPALRALVLGLSLRANDLPDAHLAALALENGGVLATLDRGLARFPGLRVIDPTAR